MGVKKAKKKTAGKRKPKAARKGAARKTKKGSAGRKKTSKKAARKKAVKKAGTKSTKKKPAKKASSKARRKQTSSAKTPRARYFGLSNSARMLGMLDILKQEYPDAHCQLDFTNAFELLIATILAAQCTDAMVNRVTPELFARYPTPRDFVEAPPEDIEEAIFKTGFYRNKTKSIQKCCRALIESHNGEVPSTMEELVALGGVGRKTANCVLGNVFGIPGIVVDTHVKRLSNRMGYTAEANPDKIEFDLMAVTPESDWTMLSHLLADHGRTICSARSPNCEECPVEHLCPKIL